MAVKALLGRAKNAAVKLAFYEWAYGMLAEGDVDVGILGEFVAGLYVGGLQVRRRRRRRDGCGSGSRGGPAGVRTGRRGFRVGAVRGIDLRPPKC